MATVTPQQSMPQTPVEGQNIPSSTSEGPVTPAQEPKASDADSARFAMLARKEKALRQRQKEIQEREAKLQSVERERESVNSFESWKKRYAQDPIAALSEIGSGYDQLTQAMLQANPEDQKYRTFEQKLRSLEEQNQALLSRLEQDKTSSYEQALNQIRHDVKSLVARDPNFETIKAMGAEDSVVELVDSYFKEYGQVLSEEEACQQIEDYLVSEALKMAALSKVKSKLAPATEEVAPQSPAPSNGSPVKTLTNQSTQGLTKPTSQKDRRERAILAFQGKLSG